jgi:hypothetical protein
MSKKGRGSLSSLGPSLCLYSPKCVEDGATFRPAPGNQEPQGSCKGLSPPRHERTIDSQQYDGSNDARYDGPYPRSSGSAATEANKTQ